MNSVANPYARLPAWIYGLVAAAILAASMSANALISIAALVSLLGFIKLLWRPGEPPVLAFAVCFQWIQATSKVFHANYLGVPLQYMSPYTTVEAATWASLAGLWILVLGIRTALSGMVTLDHDRVRSEAGRISIMRLGLAYAALTLLTSGVGAFASGLGGLRQIILAAAAVKWVAYFLFAYVILVRREKLWLLAAATAFEVVQGIGFFSGFKTVLFILIIVVVTARVRASAMRLGGVVFLAAVLLVMGLAWTAIKGEYRTFLNQGSGWQTVAVSNEEKLAKLGEMLLNLDPVDLVDAADPLFQRLAYVDYFAATMDYVPTVRPHENGSLWAASVMHVLRPRLLFPQKPVLPSDSELTMEYTGLQLASGGEGTSISIGYMGESYVDFGMPGMFAPVFLLGIFWGLIYRFFLRKERWLLAGYGFATAALVQMYQFEMASIKILGSVLMQFIVLALIFRFVLPRVWPIFVKVADRSATLVRRRQVVAG